MKESQYLPTISVVVPIYNGEKYINECVDSILNQTYRDFELILVDDGSSDNTGSICENYQLKDNRIKVIHQSNSGSSVARATGTQYAKGKFVCFVDADDSLKNDALEYLILKMNEDVDIVASESNIDIVLTPEEYACHLLKFNNWHVWGKLIRKELLDPYVMGISRFFKVGEDFLTQMRLLKNLTRSIVLLKEIKYNYRDDNPESVQKGHVKTYEYEKSVIEEVIDASNKWKFQENIRKEIMSFKLEYLSGMMGYRYDINYSDAWIKYLGSEAKGLKLSIKEKITIMSIKYKFLRILFVFERKLKDILRMMLK